MVKGHLLFILLIFYSSLYLPILTTISGRGNKKEEIDISKIEERYGNFKITGTDENIDYYFYAYSDSGYSERVQLVKSVGRNANFYVDLKDFNDKKVYLEIEYIEGKTDNWDLDYDFSNEIKLAEGEPINYYINNDNTEIKFSLDLNGAISNVWARGQKKIVPNFDLNNNAEIIGEKNFGDFIHIYLIQSSNNDNTITFRVTGSKGDFINVGYMGYNNKDSNVNIQVDGRSITGYLKKNVLENICYSIKKEYWENNEFFLGNGIIINKIGYSYIVQKDEDKETVLVGYIHKNGFIKNGLFFSKNNKQDQKICFSFPDSEEYPQYNNMDEIVFIYQLELSEENKTMTLYEPQINGILYSRSMRRGSKTAFISHNNGNFNKISLNSISSIGFPKMFVLKCDNFPTCLYDKEKLSKASSPTNINRFSTFYGNKDEGYDDSPISKKQTVFIVQCMKSEPIFAQNSSEPISSNYDLICDFNTLIYKNKNEIELIEENYFNQYALKGEIHNYKIKIAKESGINKIFIDILTYVGEVEINSTDFANKGVDSAQYYAANKISISVKTNGKSANLEDLLFSVKGTTNTYYTILVTFARSEVEVDSFITNKLQTGMAYLITLDSKMNDEYEYANKIVKFKNERTYDLVPFMVNFYSLNCEIDAIHLIDKNGKYHRLYNFEEFSQDLINPYKEEDKERYFSTEYEYRLSIEISDPSIYEGSLCKIYASAIELYNTTLFDSRDILIPDNTPQQIRFGNEIKHVSFGYIHVNYEKDILIKFNLKETAKYEITFFFENHKREKKEIVVANSIIQLGKYEWEDFCKGGLKVCYIKLIFDLVQIKDEGDNPILEFSVKSIDSQSVAYIPKNKLKLDYVQEDKVQNYYTELGVNEVGYVSINFLRGSGTFYGKIVKINLDEPEEGANWRGKYRLPTDNEIIKIDPFTKKMNIYTYNDDCKSGCYLLISVITDVKTKEKNPDINYPYSIIIKSNPSTRNYLDVPEIKIQTDQYVIGAVEPMQPQNRMYIFYSIWLDSDADHVVIDFQSNAGGMFINVGEEKPTTDRAQFKFWPNGKDNIYMINRDEIIGESETLQGIVLTIGIWTNMTDSIYTTPYSFAVRLQDEIEIFRVNSEQKVLCKSKKKGDKYRCIYVISDFKEEGIFIYANSQDKSAKCDIYGNYIDSIKYEMSKKNELSEFIPSKSNHKFSNGDKDYLYVNDKKNKKDYLLITVEVDKEATIELLSHIPLFSGEISSNPSSLQLFSAVKGNSMKLNFPSQYMEMVNIICVGGKGEIYWNETDKYYVKGRDDRLSLTTTRSNKEHKLTINSIEDKDFFVYMIEYDVRLDGVNFDVLNIDKSVNYVYLESDFPVIYFSPFYNSSIVDIDYYDIFFTFKRLISEEEKDVTYYKNYPFFALGYIVKASQVYHSRLLPEITIQDDDENTIHGVYDHAMRTGIIRVSKENIQKSKIPEYEIPCIYLKIDKTDEFKNIRKYNQIDLETTPTFSNSPIPVSEISNQFGYLNMRQYEANYVLRNDISKEYMILEFSCFDDSLKIELDGKENFYDKKEDGYGKTFYFIRPSNFGKDTIKLSVKRNNSNDIQFFLFKYLFAPDTGKLNYKLNNQNISVTKMESKNKDSCNYNVTLTPVEFTDNKKYNLTYMVRLINDKNIPKKPSLVLKPNIQNIKEYYNPKLKEGENTLLFDIYEANTDITYVEVIVQIQMNENLEYLSYNPQTEFTEGSTESDKKEEKSNTAAIIAITVVGGILFIVVIVLIIVIIIFNNRNKDLLEKVNKVSFADSDQRVDADLLLNKDKEIN